VRAEVEGGVRIVAPVVGADFNTVEEAGASGRGSGTRCEEFGTGAEVDHAAISIEAAAGADPAVADVQETGEHFFIGGTGEAGTAEAAEAGAAGHCSGSRAALSAAGAAAALSAEDAGAALSAGDAGVSCGSAGSAQRA